MGLYGKAAMQAAHSEGMSQCCLRQSAFLLCASQSEVFVLHFISVEFSSTSESQSVASIPIQDGLDWNHAHHGVISAVRWSEALCPHLSIAW